MTGQVKEQSGTYVPPVPWRVFDMDKPVINQGTGTVVVWPKTILVDETPNARIVESRILISWYWEKGPGYTFILFFRVSGPGGNQTPIYSSCGFCIASLDVWPVRLFPKLSQWHERWSSELACSVTLNTRVNTMLPNHMIIMRSWQLGEIAQLTPVSTEMPTNPLILACLPGKVKSRVMEYI